MTVTFWMLQKSDHHIDQKKFLMSKNRNTITRKKFIVALTLLIFR